MALATASFAGTPAEEFNARYFGSYDTSKVPAHYRKDMVRELSGSVTAIRPPYILEVTQTNEVWMGKPVISKFYVRQYPKLHLARAGDNVHFHVIYGQKMAHIQEVYYLPRITNSVNSPRLLK